MAKKNHKSIDRQNGNFFNRRALFFSFWLVWIFPVFKQLNFWHILLPKYPPHEPIIHTNKQDKIRENSWKKKKKHNKKKKMRWTNDRWRKIPFLLFFFSFLRGLLKTKYTFQRPGYKCLKWFCIIDGSNPSHQSHAFLSSSCRL